MKYNRVITIVLDSVGIGQAFDASKYNDKGANTVLNIDTNLGLNIPNLEKLGFGHFDNYKTINKIEDYKGVLLRIEEESCGKDSVTGHWEMMVIKLDEPFNDFTENGFPSDLIKEFERQTGRKCLCKKAASGTKVIEQYGEQHLKNGDFIVYTSLDSTFQIAAHEDIISLDELYNACEIARKLTDDDNKPSWKLSRVIARPFVGELGSFTRTSNRHDYSLDPFEETALDVLKDNGFKTRGIGKITDLFNKKGLNKYEYTTSNMDGMDKTIDAIINDNESKFIFTNLVDFDAMYGHPRDPEGYKKEIELFDKKLIEVLNVIKDDDLLIITSDHGNDPYYMGNDHTRENIFVIAYANNITAKNLGVNTGFYCIGQTICDNFGLKIKNGQSFLRDIV